MSKKTTLFRVVAVALLWLSFRTNVVIIKPYHYYGEQTAITISREASPKDDLNKTIIKKPKMVKDDLNKTINVINKKPKMVMLVGPGKTATTTVQQSFIEFFEYLRQDGYLYVGRVGTIRYLAHSNKLPFWKDKNCKAKTETARLLGKTEPPCWSAMRKEINRLHQTGLNVLVVEELLANIPFDAPSFRAATENWEVEIIIGYRRLFDWLPSIKNQNEKGAGNLKMFPSPPPSNNSTDDFYLSQFQDRNRPTSAPDFYHVMVDRANRERLLQTYTETVFHRWQSEQVFQHGSIQILNLPALGSTGVVPHLLCDVLSAKKACQKQSKLKTPKSNPSVDMNYDLIACAAVDRGILTPQSRKQRPTIVSRIKKFHQNNNKQLLENNANINASLPLECADEATLEALLRESIRIERELVPDFFNETDIRLAFNQKVAEEGSSNKFCSVNTTAIFADTDSWGQFFANLQKEIDSVGKKLK